MPLITSLAVNLVVAQLLDDTTTNKGFNYWVSQLAGSADYPEVDTFQLGQIQPDGSGNLISAQISEKTITELSLTLYPLVLVYSPRLDDDKQLTPSSFSGSTKINVDFYSTFQVSELPLNTEEVLNLAEDCMFESFNRFDTHFIWEGQPFSYNNELNTSRGPLHFGGQNWRQLIRFTFTVNFGVIIGR